MQSETETLEKENGQLEKEVEETEREVADRDALHASLQVCDEAKLAGRQADVSH